MLASTSSVWSVRDRILGSTNRGKTVIQNAVRLGLIYIVISIFCVQGMAVLVQLMIARMLGPAAFGVVRSVEVVLSIALILAGVGMPTLAIKAIAECQGDVRGQVLLRLLQLAAIGGVLVATVVSLIGSQWLVPNAASPYLKSLAWVLVLTAVSRTAINYFNGIQQFRRVSVLNVILSAASIPLILLATRRWGLAGWMSGRFLSEGIFLTAAILLLAPHLRCHISVPPRFSYFQLSRLGLGISLSLLIKTAFDGAAVLALGWLLKNSTAVGEYGLASLIISGLLVLPGALSNIYLPRLAETAGDSDVQYLVYWKILQTNAIAMLIVAVVVAAAAPVLPTVFGQGYRGTVHLLPVLALVLPCRAIASTAGTYLISLNEISGMVWMNLLQLVIGGLSYWWLIPQANVLGAAIGTVLSEALLMTVYVQHARRAHRRLIREAAIAC